MVAPLTEQNRTEHRKAISNHSIKTRDIYEMMTIHPGKSTCQTKAYKFMERFNRWQKSVDDNENLDDHSCNMC
jgi:hypothetical protein